MMFELTGLLSFKGTSCFMDKFISKTIYREHSECAKNAWLKLHKRHELQHFFMVSDAEQGMFDKGNLVELWARKLFPKGTLIEGHGEEAALLTASHIKQRTPTLFQSTFFYDKFLVRNDVLEYNEKTKKWKLYEVKGNNSLKENSREIDHIEDATFQAIVLKEQGIDLENVFIIHLNKNYVRGDDVVASELFVLSDITEKVKEREPRTRLRMERAKLDLLKSDQESVVCDCIYKGRSTHCKTFSYSYPHVPSISVHDIARISPKKLISLINSNILNIDAIPDTFELTKIQRSQVNSCKLEKPIFDHVAIKQDLQKLSYPLYFLDYESYSSPIPLFKGFKPWQQMPFQFSLQVLTNPNSEPVHFEYLHKINSDPSASIIQKLMSLIGSTGNVIVWHKSFEQMINNELGERYPEHKAFLQGLNDRIFDLEEIFKRQLYVDASFNGRTSIKHVLPALFSDFSYKKLAIQSGDDAAAKWFAMIGTNASEKERHAIGEDLRRYCHFDTSAMYKIWQFLLLIQE